MQLPPSRRFRREKRKRPRDNERRAIPRILAVLARQGIGIVDDDLTKREAGDRARAKHLRRACEELGTTFIKLGQVLFDAQRLAA